MSPSTAPITSARAPSDRGLWLAYAGLCLLCWALYVMAGTDEGQRGGWNLWKGLYTATWNMGPPIVLGVAGLPWARWLRGREWSLAQRLGLHIAGALVFTCAWQALDYATSALLYTAEHATATLQRMILWQAMWGVIVYVALMLGFGGVLHARRATAAALSAARAEAALVRAELAAINGKLNPHFLFNTLNSLSALVMTGRQDDAETMIQTLSSFYRHTLSGDPTSDLTLLDEIEMQKLYLAIEGVRFPERLLVEIAVDADVAHAKIPGMILQPLVENSVKYGVAATRNPVTITIAARREGAMLVVSVTDDGPGAPAKGTDGCGIGLGNVRDRLRARFGEAGRLVFGQTPGGGFRTVLEMPLELAYG